MKLLLSSLLCFLGGVLVGILLVPRKYGIACGSGSKFYGSEFKSLTRLAGKGIANLGGSEFYSDYYMAQKFNSERDGQQ